MRHLLALALLCLGACSGPLTLEEACALPSLQPPDDPCSAITAEACLVLVADDPAVDPAAAYVSAVATGAALGGDAVCDLELRRAGAAEGTVTPLLPQRLAGLPPIITAASQPDLRRVEFDACMVLVDGFNGAILAEVGGDDPVLDEGASTRVFEPGTDPEVARLFERLADGEDDALDQSAPFPPEGFEGCVYLPQTAPLPEGHLVLPDLYRLDHVRRVVTRNDVLDGLFYRELRWELWGRSFDRE